MLRRNSNKLVHITTVPISLGFLRGQVGFMKNRGFEVLAISSPQPALWEFGASEGIEVRAVEMPRRITPIRDLLSLVRLWRTLRRIRPTIVHSHTPKGGLLGTVAAWLAQVPVRIYHVHGLPLTTATGYKRLLLRWSEVVACRLAHEVLCVSHSVRSEAVAARLCPPGKIKVLLNGSINGVDADCTFDPARVTRQDGLRVRSALGIPEDAVVIGFTGRIVRDKGMMELVQAWRGLREDFASARLLIVGDYEPQDPVGSDVREVFEHDERVHLAGQIQDTPKYYAAMDIAVLPTYREGFPLTIMEAASMELPIVATQVPGCVDAVRDGETGILVPPRDATALANALRVYLSDPELRIRHGKASREIMLRDFRREYMWAAVYDDYRRLLKAKGIRLPEPDAEPVEMSESRA